MSIVGVKNPRSCCPFQVIAEDDSKHEHYATGFFYECNDQLFLITNWHVVSGKNWPSKKSTWPGGRRPTRLAMKIATSLPGEDSAVFAPQRLDLFKNGQPVWFEHPRLGNECDVVAIPISDLPDVASKVHRPASSFNREPIPIEPGELVFTVGFPKSISVGPGLPIWKSGYIAAEPEFGVSINGKPSRIGGMKGGLDVPGFFIDTLTREGMSGAPVFAKYVGIWGLSDLEGRSAGVTDNTKFGSEFAFLGCYGGRAQGETEGEAALALCWNENAIRAICQGGQLANLY